AAVAAAAPAGAAVAGPAAPAIPGAGTASAIPDRYIVGLKDSAEGVAGRARELAASHKGKVGSVWESGPRGFSVTMSEADAKRLAADPHVAYVQQEHRFSLADS